MKKKKKITLTFLPLRVLFGWTPTPHSTLIRGVHHKGVDKAAVQSQRLNRKKKELSETEENACLKKLKLIDLELT